MSDVELTLPVPELGPAVRFYRLLFGTGPTGQARREVRFRPADALLGLTLRPGRVDAPARLRFCADAAGLASARDRLNRAGVAITEYGLASSHGTTLPREIAVADPGGHEWRICTSPAQPRRGVPRPVPLVRWAGTAVGAIVHLARAGELERRFNRERERDQQTLRRYGAL